VRLLLLYEDLVCAHVWGKGRKQKASFTPDSG